MQTEPAKPIDSPAAGGRRLDPARIAAPALIALIAAGYLVEARRFAEPSSAEAPRLYGVAALSLCALLILQALAPASRARPANRGGEGGRGELVRAAWMMLMLAGLVALIFAVGIYAAIAVFLALFLKFISKLSWAAAGGVALVAAAVVWFLLALLLKMDVYSGYLGARLG